MREPCVEATLKIRSEFAEARVLLLSAFEGWEDIFRAMEGGSNKEIAEHIGLGAPLVKFHVRKILEKLDAPDRTRAAIVALERGIIHHDD